MPTNRTGWTLIELLAVMAILSLLMAGAVFTIRAPLTAGRGRQDIEAVLLADRTARSEARRHQRSVVLEFRWNSEPSLVIQRQSTDAGRNAVGLPTLAEVVTTIDEGFSESAAIRLDPAGRSPTYALRFVSPNGEDTWIAIAGATGHPIADLSKQQVHALLNLLDGDMTDVSALAP